jgi:hypothetical protein
MHSDVNYTNPEYSSQAQMMMQQGGYNRTEDTWAKETLLGVARGLKR